MSCPANTIFPAVGSNSRTKARPSVDLPEPEPPTMPRTWCSSKRRSSKVALCNASVVSRQAIVVRARRVRRPCKSDQRCSNASGRMDEDRLLVWCLANADQCRGWVLSRQLRDEHHTKPLSLLVSLVFRNCRERSRQVGRQLRNGTLALLWQILFRPGPFD